MCERTFSEIYYIIQKLDLLRNNFFGTDCIIGNLQVDVNMLGLFSRLVIYQSGNHKFETRDILLPAEE